MPVGVGAGAAAPVTVATSWIAPPMGAFGVAWVTMVATACITTDVSPAALHGLTIAG